MFPSCNSRSLPATTRLQESSDECTEADHGAGSDLEVGSSASRARGAGAGGSGGRTARARVASGAGSRSTRASGASAVGGRSAQDDSGRVVGADGENLSRVDATSNGNGVDARCDSRDRGRNANISVSSRLGGDDSVGSRLGRDRGGSSGHASHNTQRVGLLEVAGLGEGVDRSSRRGLGEGRSGEGSDSEGGTHVDGAGIVDLKIND